MSRHHKPKIVVLGGGTGMPILLKGLKNYPIDLSTIVTVADDGGSTGKIREVRDVPAPGDIRNVIAALANVDHDLWELFQYRIRENNDLKGHALGNILLVAMSEITGDFTEAVEQIAQLFNVKANIYPIVNESVTLHAVMDDGTVVSGESNIPIENKTIKQVYLTPKNLKPNQDAIKAILDADLVVISPGSLYTSILPNLIISDVAKALNETTATVVYVCNIMTQNGETDGYNASDHVQAIYRHVGEGTIDQIIVHNRPIEQKWLKQYEVENSYPVVVDHANLKRLGLEIIEENIIHYAENYIRHNNERLAEIIYHIAKQWK